MIDPMMLGGMDPSKMLNPMAMLNYLGMPGGGNPTPAQLNQIKRTQARANDIYLVGKSTKGKPKLEGQPKAGAKSHLDPPSKAYSQNAKKMENFMYRPLPKDGRVRFVDEEGNTIKASMSSKDVTKMLDGWMKNPKTEKKALAFADANGLEKKGGEWMQKVPADQAAGGFMPPGMAGNPMATAASSFTNRGQFFGPGMDMAGMAMGASVGAPLGTMAGAAFGPVGMVGGGMLGMLGGGLLMSKVMKGSGMGGGGFGGMAALGAVGGMFGNPGIAFNMKKQVNSSMRQMQDSGMISMINNPGIPIEDLLFLFMAYMGDKYDKKLREKMEETALAERRAEQREMEMDRANMLGGMVSSMGGGMLSFINPVFGMGAQMAGGMITQGLKQQSAMKDAAGGYTKSTTMLMNEVQLLMQKWKQINEMVSNLLKNLHDMNMTPIRNLR